MTLLLRLALWFAPRLMLGLALGRRLTGRETARDLAERLGRHGPGRAVWVHGASNGELASAAWVIAALAERGAVHVTSSTVTGREMVRGWGLNGVSVGLAPLDLPGVLRRHLTPPPRAFVNLEGEIWPARFAALRRAGVPLVLIGARLSERSGRRWARVAPGILEGLWTLAQDDGSARRLADLGARVEGLFDLKAEALRRAGPALRGPRAGRAGVVLAASTHAGEEETVLAAFRASGASELILAPRHPARADEIARLIAAQGLRFARRSTGAAPGTAPVYLADTMGEMDLWYARAGICFVGGSLVDKGGHTPWEPLRHGAVVVHGPHVGNFAAVYAALDQAGAALEVQGPEDLAAALRLPAPEQDRRAEAADAVALGLRQAHSASGTALLRRLFDQIP